MLQRHSIQKQLEWESAAQLTLQHRNRSNFSVNYSNFTEKTLVVSEIHDLKSCYAVCFNRRNFTLSSHVTCYETISFNNHKISPACYFLIENIAQKKKFFAKFKFLFNHMETMWVCVDMFYDFEENTVHIASCYNSNVKNDFVPINNCYVFYPVHACKRKNDDTKIWFNLWPYVSKAANMFVASDTSEQ